MTEVFVLMDHFGLVGVYSSESAAQADRGPKDQVIRQDVIDEPVDGWVHFMHPTDSTTPCGWSGNIRVSGRKKNVSAYHPEKDPVNCPYCVYYMKEKGLSV